MPQDSHPFRVRFRQAWLAFATSLMTLSVLGQNAPTADQMEAFRNLPQDQQQVILDRVTQGGGGNATRRDSGTGSTTQNSDKDRPIEQRRRGADSDEDDARDPMLRTFKPGDSVLVQVDFQKRRFEPAPLGAPPPPAGAGTSQQDQRAAAAAAPTAGNGAASQAAGQWIEPPELTDEQKTKLKDLIELLRARNPYKLDRNGALILPGFQPIPLGGLTEIQATQRLSAEPALFLLSIKLIRLPLAKTGLDILKPFGYDLFDDSVSTFAPLNNVPVPADFVVGPGDELSVQLYGTSNRNLTFRVGRDGRISFPEIGPINVGGLTFDAVRTQIESRVERQMIGVRASVSVGGIRSIRVFVLGEAKQPGSFTVGGLATMTSALFASGGVKPIGSLRNIQLKRQGAVVRRLDLYDMLIRGDTANDALLQPGDAIFIPPVGQTVSIEGEVKRPAIYELRGENSVDDLIEMAGGVTPEADRSRLSLTTIDEQSRRVVNPVNLALGDGARTRLRNGDVLRISRLRPTLDSGVTVQGAVFRPGPYAWHAGLRLSDVLGSVDELQPNADQHYLMIRRETPPNRRVSVISADLAAALASRGSAADAELMPRDQITVFDLAPGRERVIKPIMDELRLQSGLDRPTEVVRVEGRVKVPGEYPLEPDMRVSDLVRAGGNLDAGAFGGTAEPARYRVVDGQSRQTELIPIDLAAVRRGDLTANITLQPYDHLLIKETPYWKSEDVVILKGEVKFPGTYPIRHGETLRELMDRAGGLTDLAFARGAAFTRKELKELEQKQLETLTDRMQTEVATMSLQAAQANQVGASQALTAGQGLLAQLRGSKAVGRMVIDLPALMAAGAHSAADVALQDGDTLVIPRERQEVTVIGEVQSATSHQWRAGFVRDDYIAMSGGFTRRADGRRTYVVRADGAVVPMGSSSLFRRHYERAVEPGDTIVVPIDTERLPRLPFWQAVTQIVYNLAVSVAAIRSF